MIRFDISGPWYSVAPDEARRRSRANFSLDRLVARALGPGSPAGATMRLEGRPRERRDQASSARCNGSPPSAAGESGGHRLAGFQERLEVAENPWPSAAALGLIAAARDHAGKVRRARNVMGNGHGADAALILLDLIGQARMRFRGAGLVPDRVPCLHQLAGRIAFDHLADDDLLGHAHRSHHGAVQS